MADLQPSINSPCIGLCAVNDDNICIGCYRSLQEIGTWLQLDDKSKTQILANCHDRMKCLQPCDNP